MDERHGREYQPHHAGAGGAGEPFEYKLSERWKVRDDNGYRIVKPPWGYVTAIDNATQFDRNSLCEDFPR